MLQKNSKVTITTLLPENVPEAVAMVKDVFDEFIAPGYSMHGNDVFYTHIGGDAVRDRIERGNIFLITKTADEIIGIIEIRDRNHIALFYVRKDWHNRKIGRTLFDSALETVKRIFSSVLSITVNSSPYAVPIYESLGFERLSEIQEREGIRYVPIEYRVNK